VTDLQPLTSDGMTRSSSAIHNLSREFARADNGPSTECLTHRDWTSSMSSLQSVDPSYDSSSGSSSIGSSCSSGGRSSSSSSGYSGCSSSSHGRGSVSRMVSHVRLSARSSSEDITDSSDISSDDGCRVQHRLTAASTSSLESVASPLTDLQCSKLPQHQVSCILNERVSRGFVA